MSTRNDPYSIEMLLIEYMIILREQTTHQSNVIQTFVESNRRNFEGVRSLMQRYLETLIDNRRENEHTTSINSQFRTNPQQAPVSFFNSGNNRMSNRTTTPSYSLSHRYNRSSRLDPGRNYTQSPLSSTGLRRRNVRSSSRINRPTHRRRNLLNQILETTLYTSNPRRPARSTDISRNVTFHLWQDISNTTDQIMDPITQEDFQPENRVARIDYCGHLFMEDALMTYLTEFDHRCPICRYNMSSEIFPPRTYAEAAASPGAAAPPSEPPTFSFNPTSRGGRRLFENATNPSWYPLDISYNINNFSFDLSSNVTPNIPPNTLTRQNSFDISFNPTSMFGFDFNSTDIDSAVNQLSTAMLSSLSSAMANPDNSGNTIAAEYSLFLPTSRTRHTTDNSTNTEDTANDADDVNETY